MENINLFKKSYFFKLFTVIILTGSLFLTSCEEDPGDEMIEITADAGNDATVLVGDTVSLDGSASSITEGDLTYSWIFLSKPSGSNAQLYGSSTPTPYFVADVEGEFVLELMVSSGDQSKSDDVSITASVVHPDTKEISGTISTNTTWTDQVSDPDIPDYLITGHVYLDAQLSVDPGVLIHVKEDKGLYVNGSGSLITNGSAGSEVVFTSADETGNLYWRGIMVKSNSSDNKLEYTKVKYAGNSEFGFSGTNYATAIGIENGKLSLLNSEVSHSKSYGLFLHSGELNQFSMNMFSGNMKYSIRINASQAGKLDNATTFSDPSNAVEIYGSTLDETTETTWPDLAGNARYYVSGWVYINSYLSIDPGAIFDFAEDKALKVNSTGVFIADASGGDPIVFTSKRAASGIYWKGIWILSSDARNILSNVEVSYGGNTEFNFSGYNYAAAVAIEDGKLGVVNTTISNSNNYGLYLHDGTSALTNFDSNVFADNAGSAVRMMANEVKQIDAATSFSGNGWDGVAIYGSTVTDQATWVDLNGTSKYKVEGWIYVENGLTINENAWFAFNEDEALVVRSSGYLVAKGSLGNPVTFTSSNEAGQIRWAGIWIQTSDARNELDYAVVNYAGGYEFNYAGTNYTTAIAGDDDDNPYLTLTNSVVKNSGAYAVYWEGGTINDVESAAAGNTFTNNANNPDVVIP
jgi:hypothetical protein